MALNEDNLNEGKKSISFVEQFVEEDLLEGKMVDAYRLVSHLNQMAIFI